MNDYFSMDVQERLPNKSLKNVSIEHSLVLMVCQSHIHGFCSEYSVISSIGIAYGSGVYFHTHANYSNQYAKPDITGERTMFLARVLVGKTAQGNQSMKVPPPGCDTTTDGQNIFVVYHDAGAYADYLITYR